MKKRIKDFFLKRRLKVLKNKKGFSLIEVLVAVGLIGIITAIAVPQFQDYREQTGLVAGNTSVSNIAKAYQNCMALNAFTDCDELDKIKISCAECSDATLGAEPPFCANYKTTAGGKEFRMCVSVDANNSITKTIGGNFKVCHNTCTGSACPGGQWTTSKVPSTVKRCKTAAADCQTTDVKPASAANKTYAVQCQANTVASAGTCATSGGTCQ